LDSVKRADTLISKKALQTIAIAFYFF